MKRPWNIIDSPIYSLQTVDRNGKINMNICTYVTAVSMKPKIYAIAIDYNTLTYKNVKNSNQFVLQLLSKNQIELVKKFGKKSGYKFNKDKFLRDKKLLINWNDFEVLHGTTALIKIDKKNPINSTSISVDLSSFQSKSIVVIDDVLNSGSTLMYAVKYFLETDLKQLKTAVLVDRNHKKFPIKADFKGVSLSTSLQNHVNVVFNEDSIEAFLH